MKSLRLLALSVGLLCSSFATAQVGSRVSGPPKEGKDNPCANLGTPPTVASCWACFQSLLADCDKNNPNADRRKACYEGANNFFTWCLGRVGGPNNGVKKKPGNGNMSRGEGFEYTIAFDQPTTAEQISVYVRDMNGNEARQQEVKAFVIEQEDGSFSVFFDNNNLGLDDDKTVGVVTTVRSADGSLDVAYATAYSLVDPLDLNEDSMVDEADVIEAWNRYSDHEMTFEELVSFVKAVEAR